MHHHCTDSVPYLHRVLSYPFIQRTQNCFAAFIRVVVMNDRARSAGLGSTVLRLPFVIVKENGEAKLQWSETLPM